MSWCSWEGCDNDAAYCAGHALEYANVSSENEAILLRHKVERLEGLRRDLTNALRLVINDASRWGYPDGEAVMTARQSLFKCDRLFATMQAEETARRRAT